MLGVGGVEEHLAPEHPRVGNPEIVPPSLAPEVAAVRDAPADRAIALAGICEEGEAHRVVPAGRPGRLPVPLVFGPLDGPEELPRIQAGHIVLALQAPVAAKKPGVVLHDRAAEGEGGIESGE